MDFDTYGLVSASSSYIAPGEVAPAVIMNLQQILVGKYFFLAGLTVLLYDHLITFPAEIQTVWKKKKTFVLYLFLVIRYYAPIAVAIVCFGFFSTAMTRDRCAHWMKFLPLGITMPLSIMPGIIMLIRVYALYNRNKVILIGLVTILAAQTAAGLWQYTVKGATPAPLPLDNYEFHFCIYLPPKRIGHLSTMYVFWELGFDSLIFLLTISRTVYMFWRHQVARSNNSPGLIALLIRDGAFYFGAIFSMNLMWVIMIMHAPTGLRAIASIPSSCITTVFICRITLNLRTTVYGPAQLFERTQNNIPLTEVHKSTASPRTRRSNYAPFDPTATENLQIHIRTEYEGDTSGSHSFPFSNGNGYGVETLDRKPTGSFGAV